MTDSLISLLDLNQQLPFEIDKDLKREICFSETLVISCGHYEGDVAGDESSESEWSCTETSESTTAPEEVKPDLTIDAKPNVEEAEPEQESEEDDDFHFFFFPDCKKPLPEQHSKTSLILVDGLPKVNPAVAEAKFCTCDVDRKGKCVCHTKLPCYCGAKVQAECTCAKAENICICDENKPNLVCTCGAGKVCTCRPNESPYPVCTCAEVDKPCICHPGKFATPVCTCKEKPKFGCDCYSKLHQSICTCEYKTPLESIPSIMEEFEGELERMAEQYEGQEIAEGTVSKVGQVMSGKLRKEKSDTCECQKPDPKPVCLCIKGKECICKEDLCICGVQKSCVCEKTSSADIFCKSQSSRSICSCPIPRECVCDGEPEDCKCFIKKECTCGDPKKCKCATICDCTAPCICDTMDNKSEECVCRDPNKRKTKDLVCTCITQDTKGKKLKKVRAGKHGYRWCHVVDPKHTFFDYGYGMHDKISFKEQEKEKFKILGLHDEKSDDVCEVHGIKIPPYERKIRKPSMDCCSAVGGISISVETLEEDKDKLLIQVVSHSSKEGSKTGTKFVSIVDLNLHTLEENRLESITNRDITKERRLYIAICENGYYSKVTRICGERDVVKRNYYNFQDAHDLLLEGANIVLLRYFGLRRYKGTVKTTTMLMDGTICESIYNCMGVSQAIVNGKPLFVVKVERHIIEPSGFIHQTLTVLSLRGYIVNLEWADSTYMLHINPLLRIIPEKDEIEQHAPLRETWREDLQLLSDYLDFKSVRTSEGARYVAEKGELTAQIRDYLQAVLLLRPQDVLHFTRHYFESALSAMDLPHDEYFDSCPKHVRYFYFED